MDLLSFFKLKQPFMKRTDSPLSVFQWIIKCEHGRKALTAFLPLFHTGKVLFKRYPEDILSKLRASNDNKGPVGASFVCDGDKGTIYYDASNSIAVNSVLFLHEITHCLDENLWTMAKRPPLDTPTKNSILLTSEKKAYQAQAVFLDQLEKSMPEITDYLKKEYPQASFIHSPPAQEAVAEIYGLAA